MQCHQEQSDLARSYAKYGDGDILNFLQDQSELFNSIETWFIAQVESEVAVFDKSYFARVWEEDLMTEELQLKRSIAQCYPVFENLSELVIIALVSEFFQTKRFAEGEFLVAQSKYSPSNKTSRQYFDFFATKFGDELKNKTVGWRRATRTSEQSPLR